MTVTFFGHRSAPSSVTHLLRKTLIDLIEKKNANAFFVGNEGNFDKSVQTVLKELSLRYPHIRYTILLAYMPKKKTHFNQLANTALPDGIEAIPPRYAISFRNRFMILHSDTVITYVTHSVGGACKYKEMALRKNKYVINLV